MQIARVAVQVQLETRQGFSVHEVEVVVADVPYAVGQQLLAAPVVLTHVDARRGRTVRE